jgi:hypothetical protein
MARARCRQGGQPYQDRGVAQSLERRLSILMTVKVENVRLMLDVL